MFEQYIGKKLSVKEIFNTFVGMSVTGKPDSSQYPALYITIDFIGTPDEAKARFERGDCCIHHGRPERKGEGIIWDSQITPKDLVGVWNTSVTADGGMSDECMVLKADGSGIFAESNLGGCFGTLIEWYAECDVLYINTDNRNICGDAIELKHDVIVPCMSKGERRFSKLSVGAYGYPYYRDIVTDKTLAELEEWAINVYDTMMAVCDRVK